MFSTSAFPTMTENRSQLYKQEKNKLTINPLTQSETEIITKSLQLNALDAASLMLFYRDKIGLTLHGRDNTDQYYALGTGDGKILLEIFQTTIPKMANAAGLYHMAFRLPGRKDLGTILLHLANHQVQLTGAADHGYSEALYLNDPEGNGIEIYWDKPGTEWDIRADGSIAGIVERLDVNELASLATAEFEGLPLGSDLGHMHIHVADLKATWAFYREVLGLGFKYPLGNQAIFMATGDYHHHLGANTWLGSDLLVPGEGQQGLRSYSWQASDTDYARIKERLEAGDIQFEERTDQLWFMDNSGLTVVIDKAV